MRSSEIAVEEGVGIGEDDELESVTSGLEPGFADLGLARIAIGLGVAGLKQVLGIVTRPVQTAVVPLRAICVFVLSFCRLFVFAFKPRRGRGMLTEPPLVFALPLPPLGLFPLYGPSSVYSRTVTISLAFSKGC